jgi:hypothetical protein
MSDDPACGSPLFTEESLATDERNLRSSKQDQNLMGVYQVVFQAGDP